MYYTSYVILYYYNIHYNVIYDDFCDVRYVWISPQAKNIFTLKINLLIIHTYKLTNINFIIICSFFTRKNLVTISQNVVFHRIEFCRRVIFYIVKDVVG